MNEVNIVPIWGINTYQNNRDLKQISSHNNKASLGIRNTFRCIKLDLWIIIVAPLVLLLKWEWKICPTHGFLSLTWSAICKCVSCRNAISVFIFFRWAKMPARLFGPFIPLTFQLIKRMEDPPSFINVSHISQYFYKNRLIKVRPFFHRYKWVM